jgi:hypothetical protein
MTKWVIFSSYIMTKWVIFSSYIMTRWVIFSSYIMTRWVIFSSYIMTKWVIFSSYIMTKWVIFSSYIMTRWVIFSSYIMTKWVIFSSYIMTRWVIFSSYIMTKTSCIGWDDDNDLLVLDKHDWCEYYRSLNQQSACRHVALLENIILIPSQPVFALISMWYVFRGEATHTNFIVFVLSTKLQIPNGTIKPCPMTSDWGFFDNPTKAVFQYFSYIHNMNKFANKKTMQKTKL